jgi:lipoprotein-anchoring transpeptidase ErfK/SrfK
LLSTKVKRVMITRRRFLASAALLAVPYRANAEELFPIDLKQAKQVAFKHQMQEVKFETAEPEGTIIVDPKKCFLYLVQGNGTAIRYGVAVGKSTHAWTGEVTIAKMKEWPRWFPAPYHTSVKPELAKWLPDGMPGGPDNPLGARSMYLFKGDVDTVNRIHGAAKVSDIGRKATAGCIGMINAHIVDLYGRVQVGTRVLMQEKKGFFG